MKTKPLRGYHKVSSDSYLGIPYSIYVSKTTGEFLYTITDSLSLRGKADSLSQSTINVRKAIDEHLSAAWVPVIVVTKDFFESSLHAESSGTENTLIVPNLVNVYRFYRTPHPTKPGEYLWREFRHDPFKIPECDVPDSIGCDTDTGWSDCPHGTMGRSSHNPTSSIAQIIDYTPERWIAYRKIVHELKGMILRVNNFFLDDNLQSQLDRASVETPQISSENRKMLINIMGKNE